MIALFGLLTWEFLLAVAPAVYPEHRIVPAVVMTLWAAVWMTGAAYNPPSGIASKICWCLAMWGYLIGLPRYIAAAHLGAPEPVAHILGGFLVIGLPAALILPPVLYALMGSERIRRVTSSGKSRVTSLFRGLQ